MCLFRNGAPVFMNLIKNREYVIDHFTGNYAGAGISEHACEEACLQDMHLNPGNKLFPFRDVGKLAS